MAAFLTLLAIVVGLAVLVRHLQDRGWSRRRVTLGVVVPVLLFAALLAIVWYPAGHGATTIHAARLRPPASGSLQGLPSGYGRLSGSVGPGAPPNGTIPDMVLTFSRGAVTFNATVRGGVYQIDLPAGTWDVSSPDGVCATGLSVAAGGAQRDDLVYPIGGCQDLAGPPTPNGP